MLEQTSSCPLPSIFSSRMVTSMSNLPDDPNWYHAPESVAVPLPRGSGAPLAPGAMLMSVSSDCASCKTRVFVCNDHEGVSSIVFSLLLQRRIAMSVSLEHVVHMAAQRAYHELDLLLSLLPREVLYSSPVHSVAQVLWPEPRFLSSSQSSQSRLVELVGRMER